MTVYATQLTSIVTSKYRKLEPGQNITGILLSELKTTSRLQCSERLVFIYTKAKANPKAIFSLIFVTAAVAVAETQIGNNATGRKRCRFRFRSKTHDRF